MLDEIEGQSNNGNWDFIPRHQVPQGTPVIPAQTENEEFHLERSASDEEHCWTDEEGRAFIDTMPYHAV